MKNSAKKEGKKVCAEELAKKAIALIKNKADPEKAVQAQRYFKDEVSVYGLTAAESREIAKNLYQEVRNNWTVKQAVELCEILLPNKYLEVKSLATLIFLRYRKDFERPVFPLIKKWLSLDYCNNWASVDVLCPDSLGILLEKYPDLTTKIMSWTDSPNRWVRRASAVSLIKLARQGKYLDAVYRISRRLFPVADDLIEKANGWLLREAGKTDMLRLEKFILRHGPRIPRTTLRYAIERFPESKRRLLLLKTKTNKKGFASI